jgi:hypothetical protein
MDFVFLAVVAILYSVTHGLVCAIARLAGRE